MQDSDVKEICSAIAMLGKKLDALEEKMQVLLKQDSEDEQKNKIHGNKFLDYKCLENGVYTVTQYCNDTDLDRNPSNRIFYLTDLHKLIFVPVKEMKLGLPENIADNVVLALLDEHQDSYFFYYLLK